MTDVLKFKSVLVIDDDEAIRGSLRMLLEFNDFVVECCHDGKSGLELAHEKCFDVIVIDYQMPGLKGDETTRSLRAICPTAFIIGISLEERGQAFRQAGANAFISKDQLLAKLFIEINNGLSQQEAFWDRRLSGEADTD